LDLHPWTKFLEKITEVRKININHVENLPQNQPACIVSKRISFVHSLPLALFLSLSFVPFFLSNFLIFLWEKRKYKKKEETT
jgi:hypothetical protein